MIAIILLLLFPINRIINRICFHSFRKSKQKLLLAGSCLKTNRLLSLLSDNFIKAGTSFGFIHAAIESSDLNSLRLSNN